MEFDIAQLNVGHFKMKIYSVKIELYAEFDVKYTELSLPTESRGFVSKLGWCSSLTSANHYFHAVKLLHHPNMSLETVF